MTAEEQLKELRFYIENKRDDAISEREMYLKNEEHLFKNTDSSIACCRAIENACQLILLKMDRLDKTITTQ